MNPISSSRREPEFGFDAEVLVVGAGPVGLLLANLLGARGVRVLLVDQRETPPESSMAIGVTPPSLEILRSLDLDRVFQEAGVPVRHAEVHEARRCLGRLDFAGIGSDYPFFLSLPQAQTIAILREKLNHFPTVRLQGGVAFTGLTTERRGVRARLRNAGAAAETQVAVQFVVGADGHRSRVRAAAGLTVRERDYPQRFIMGDFADASGLGTEARLYFSAEASVESFPLPGGWRRWIVQTAAVPGPALAAHLTAQVARLAGHPLRPEKARFVSAFGAKRMEVNHYHAGRVALAGDAAHVMSSIGGQGMNTGFADAELLAAVLARALREPAMAAAGFAAYEKIRRRAFVVAARRAERGMRLGTLRGRAASGLRRVFIRHVLFGVLRRRLAPHFAMLTIPYRNLNHVPPRCLPAR